MSSAQLQSSIHFLDLSCSPTQCGYCGGRGSLSQGMWVERLTVRDYQDLLDRGWRRSGRYVYKPCMSLTCCPQYTIRCRAGKYQPTKSQRKVVKRVHNFIKHGQKSRDDGLDTAKCTASEAALKNDVGSKKILESIQETKIAIEECKDISDKSSAGSTQFKRVEGLKKARILRRERYLEKLIKSGGEVKSKAEKQPKTIATLIPRQNSFALNQKRLQSDTNSTHKFEMQLVKADLADKQFMMSFHESFRVYQRYQTSIHQDKPQDCDIQTFAGFLCDSPLIYEMKDNKGFGAFHQQYLVDGAIVAVGVVDILPHSLSSVYLYYDPVWWGKGPNLSPGTYTAIREVQLTQQLDLPFYYMGFYIHSCPKMRYKGRFLPSDLLSPTLLSWHNIEHCLPQMEAAKYSTFADIPVTGPAVALSSMEVGRVRLCVRDRLTSYEEWKGEGVHSEEVEQYHALVGQNLVESLVLRWGGRAESDDESV
eukprot:GFUD01027094.1.p1 GENE.GFUD01027094.1~~GFUD01027094.1.p1  ORF type:complete len:479 (-),score=151.71 GFUD01027094.1:22-1458(-)